MVAEWWRNRLTLSSDYVSRQMGGDELSRIVNSADWMGIGSSIGSSGRRQCPRINTNPSSSSTTGCCAACCACFRRSVADCDLEFYVHGIDFLPEYEKRRRRLVKLVRGGHLWSWNTSYMCFVSGTWPEFAFTTSCTPRSASCQSSCLGKQHCSEFLIAFHIAAKCAKYF